MITQKFLLQKKERVDKQYYTDFIINLAETKSLIEHSETLIEEIDIFRDFLTEEKRNNIRETVKKTNSKKKNL